MKRLPLLAFALLLLLGAAPGHTQPFSSYLKLAGDPLHGYIEIPHHAALNPASAFTVEAWVFLEELEIPSISCRALAGKNYRQAWFLGYCASPEGFTLRSYIKDSLRDGGAISALQWTHVALVFGGGRRKHYVDGVLVLDVAESGPAGSSTAPVRIGSDVSFAASPSGLIDEVRLWNAARSQQQLRSTLNQRLASPQPGLVAVWGMDDGTPQDILGNHDGSVHGAASFAALSATGPCVSGGTSLCLNGRFAAHADWRTATDAGAAQVVNFQTSESGLFWFFSPTNWEIQIKVLNGCALNAHYWTFTASTTNVFYRLEVRDTASGINRIYFNYAGPPAPALTDTSSIQNCP